MVNKELIEIHPLVDINIIKECLCRMGIANKKKKILYPSCYVYVNFEKYYILHFKSLFTIIRSNGYNNLSEKDTERRNSIILYLCNWKLISIENENDIIPHNESIYVLQYKDKKYWNISHKFNTNNNEVLN